MRPVHAPAAAFGRSVIALLLPLVSFSGAPVQGQEQTQTLTQAQGPHRTHVRAVDCSASAPRIAAARVVWRAAHDGMQWGDWTIAVGEANVPIRVIVVLLDPVRVALSLELKRDGSRMVPWSIDDAPANARIALNAGQFTDDGPWGWVVHRGRQWQAPGNGPLAGALVVDSAGGVRLLDASDISGARARGGFREAVQSYPTLLDAHGAPPAPLCRDDRGIDRGHRDTRLAIGTQANGRVLVALTRFDGLGSAAERLPIGPTTPEMATIMQALGATRALMLDGGLSAQLLIRDGAQAPHRWSGLRSVPLALIGLPGSH